MKKLFMLSVFLLSSLVVWADGETKVAELAIPVVKCGPDTQQISVIINDIPCKAASCQGGTKAGDIKGGFSALAQLMSGSGGVQNIGLGVKTMLSSALKETKCFNIVDTEQLEKLKKIAAMTGQEVKMPKIELFIDGAITSIDVTKSGGALAGGYIPIVGLISKTKESANMTFDLSVLNPLTAEMIDAKSFTADSSKSSWGLGAGGFAGAGGVGGWSISKSLVLDNVVRDVIFNIANHLADTFTPKYIVSRPNAEGVQVAVQRDVQSTSQPTGEAQPAPEQAATAASTEAPETGTN